MTRGHETLCRVGDELAAEEKVTVGFGTKLLCAVSLCA